MMVAQFADACRAEGIAYCAGTLAPDVLAMLASGGAAAAVRGTRITRATSIVKYDPDFALGQLTRKPRKPHPD
jgi:hypothetical protein